MDQINRIYLKSLRVLEAKYSKEGIAMDRSQSSLVKRILLFLKDLYEASTKLIGGPLDIALQSSAV